MSKIYISALGAGNYKPSTYFQDSFESIETRYVQIATMDLWHCNEWKKENEDKIILLVTERAKTQCLDDHLYKDRDNNTEYQVKGLYNEMKDAGIDENIIVPISIKDGKDKDEIMDIFTLLNEEISKSKEAELYFDLTYGLRYLPMLILVFNNYSRFVNKTKCVSMAYGSYETPIDGKTPIIDLEWLDNIQQWSTAAENFVTSGNSNGFNRLVREENKQKRRTTTKIPVRLEDVTTELLACHGRGIIEGKIFDRLFTELDNDTNNADVPKPLIPVLGLIKQDMSGFSGKETWKNGLTAAKWCYDHRLYQQSLTLLREIGITYLCISLGLDFKEEDDRDIIGTLLFILRQNQSKGPVFVNSTIDSYISTINENKCLSDWLDILNGTTDIRNNYNHAGMKKGKLPQKVDTLFYRAIGQKIEEALAIEYPKKLIIIKPKKFKKEDRLFINLTNHSSDSWGEKQKSEAEKYGRIVDMKFPMIDSSATEGKIKKVSELLIKRIQNITEGNIKCTIHVMGEMTLTYSLVKQLSNIGYTCVASTTTRNVITNEDGTKTSKFEFERFRRYIKKQTKKNAKK